MRKLFARTVAVLSGTAVAGALALSMAGTAGATTLTCTHTQNALTSPIGCGGMESASTSHGTLNLAVLGTGSASGNYFNSPVGVKTESQSNSREDFTVFAVGGSTTSGPGHLGEYVAMYTPLGKIASFTGTVNGAPGTYANATPDAGTTFTVGSNVYCLSVVSQNNGPGNAARWNVILRNCNGNGTFTMGNDSNVVNSVTSGHANRWQVWAPVTGSFGLLMVNSTLSHGFKSGNVQYVADIRGAGGDGASLLAYPENDQTNEEWSIIGCTAPVTLLNTSYAACP